MEERNPGGVEEEEEEGASGEAGRALPGGPLPPLSVGNTVSAQILFL